MPTVTKSTVITSSTVPSNAMPLQIGVTPALWLDGADSSTLISDGAASFAAASNTYLSRLAANSTTLQTGNVDWWWSFWMYATGTGTNNGGRIICKRNGNDADYDICRGSSSGKVELVLGSGSGIQTFQFDSFVTGSWRHYLIYKSGSTVNYIGNGVSGTPQNVTITPAVSSIDFAIGNYSANVVNRVFDGYLDSVAFGKPASGWLASNVSSLATYLYNSGAGRRSSDFKASSYYLNGNPSGAVSWWDLDERSGTRNDKIGSNHLTDNNSVGYAAGIASGAVQYDGDQITSWNDKSGNFRHATASSQSVRPTYKISSINNQGFVQYDGIDDVLTIQSSTATFAFLHQSPSTVFMVVSIGSSSDVNALVLLVNNNGSSSGLIGFAISYDDRASINRNNGINSFISTGVGGQTPVVAYSDNYFPTQTVGMLSLMYDPANATGASRHTMYLNGGNAKSTNSATATPVASNASNNLAIGGVNAQIRFYELIIYPSLLSTSQRQRIERYLAEKWMSPPTVTLITSSSSQYLEWAAVDMAGSYKVYYRVNGTTAWTLALTTTSLYAVITGLTVGTAYDFRVDAVWSV